MDPRAGLDGYGNFASTGIRSPDRVGRSESLYCLSYPGHFIVLVYTSIHLYTLIQTLVILIDNYPDRLRPSGKFVENSRN